LTARPAHAELGKSAFLAELLSSVGGASHGGIYELGLCRC
jgi:hypothetical protein